MIIYKATNKINQKVYIGRTIQSFKQRIYDHKRNVLVNGYNNYFYKAIRKYGIDSFKWEIIDTAKNIKELNILEQFFIDHYREIGEVYNLTDGGDGISGYNHSEISKQKMSEAHKGEKNYFYGKKHTEESKKKISEARKGKPSGYKGKHQTVETRKKLSEASKGNQNWLGKKHSEKTKQKISEARKNISIETRERISEAQKGNKNCLGRKLSKETKRKISESQKKRWAKRKGTVARIK